MQNIQLVSHEEFPEDPYVKELAYLCLDGKYRVAYVRKQAKNGGMFWSVVNTSVIKNGVKSYFECFMLDSNFMERDIMTYLESKPWKVNSSSSVSLNENEIPF